MSAARHLAARGFAATLALCATALPLLAADPMTGPEFEAYVEGRTLTFHSRGVPYGVEQYHEGRRVTWSFLDGQCKDGVWYAEGPFICFAYEDNSSPQCWTFHKEGNGLRALYNGTEGETELYEASDAEEKMVCLGPEVGV